MKLLKTLAGWLLKVRGKHPNLAKPSASATEEAKRYANLARQQSVIMDEMEEMIREYENQLNQTSKNNE